MFQEVTLSISGGFVELGVDKLQDEFLGVLGRSCH